MASITINMRSDWLKREYKHLRRATSIDEDTRDVTRYSVMAWKSAVLRYCSDIEYVNKM